MEPNDLPVDSALLDQDSGSQAKHGSKAQADKKKKKHRPQARRAVISQLPSSTSVPDFRTLHRKIDESAELSPQEKRIVGRPVTVYDLLKADIPFSTNNFPLCPHPHHCLQNAFFKGFLRTFAAGYFFKTTVALVTKLFGGKIFVKNHVTEKLAGIYFGEDAIRFALFIGLMSFTYKSILCSLRRYRNKDPVYHKTLAGFISAAFILVDDPSRRRSLALYCIVRSIGDVLRLMIERKDIPNIPHGNVLSFTISQLFIMYGSLLRPEAVDPKYYNWIKNVGNLREESIQKIFRAPIGSPFLECSPTWHEHPSCVVHTCTDFFLAIARSSRVYIPVHFLPPLLFYPKSVFSNPIDYFKKKGWNTLISSIFLATYQFNMKATLCFFRNLTRENNWWIPVLGGLASGLSLFVEHSKRRIELALYCVPRALEIVMRLISKDMFPTLYALLRKSWLPVLSFQAAIALWMTVLGSVGGDGASNSLNVSVLRVVFGSKH